MNRRKTDLIIDTQAFANSCALLDNAKLREALANSELELKKANDLLARAGSALILLMSCINEDIDGNDNPINICVEEQQLADDILEFLVDDDSKKFRARVDRVKYQHQVAIDKLGGS